MVPFSRFAGLIPLLFSGRAQTHWRGIRLRVDPGETFGYFLYFCGEREPDVEFDWLLAHANGARMFVDVGAHIGLYAIALAAHRPSLSVTAFEASPTVAGQLRDNIALNPGVASRITVVEQAVSSSVGTQAFLEASGLNSSVGRLVEQPKVPGRSTLRVNSITLADYFDNGEPPDVVKIDVEGAELDVLEGWGALPPARAVLVELHQPDPHEQVDRRPIVINWFLARGYRLQYLVGDFIVDECPQPIPARLHVLATHSAR